jgi:hypothetical protein
MLDCKRVLHCLSGKTLPALSKALETRGWIVLNKGMVIERLAGADSITRRDLLAHPKIPSPKETCQVPEA